MTINFLQNLSKVAGDDPRIPDETTANGYVADIRKQQYEITNVSRKPVKRNAPAPFITSTLQQEAAKRLRHILQTDNDAGTEVIRRSRNR